MIFEWLFSSVHIITRKSVTSTYHSAPRSEVVQRLFGGRLVPCFKLSVADAFT